MSVEPATQREEAEVECPGCSEAGGAGMPVYHLPPICKTTAQREEASRDTTDCPECPTYFPKGHSHYHTFPGPSLPEEASRDTRKCGKPAKSFIPRWGWSFACVLAIGHDGDCQPGGNCFKHGEYIGDQCPQHPGCIIYQTEARRVAQPAESTNASLRRRIDALEPALREARAWLIASGFDGTKVVKSIDAALASGETEVKG